MFNPGHHSSFSSSTSNIRVAFGGMTPGWPVGPYAISGVQVIFALWPRLICEAQEEKEHTTQYSVNSADAPFCAVFEVLHTNTWESRTLITQLSLENERENGRGGSGGGVGGVGGGGGGGGGVTRFIN